MEGELKVAKVSSSSSSKQQQQQQQLGVRSVCLPVCRYVGLSVCLSVRLPVRLSIWLAEGAEGGVAADCVERSDPYRDHKTH